MLEEFISSDEFREKSGMSESQIAAIVLNIDATNLLANGVRALVKEFCKDQDNQLKIMTDLDAIKLSASDKRLFSYAIFDIVISDATLNE